MAPPVEPEPEWHDAREFWIEGQAWPSESAAYARLPARARGRVSEDNWRLGFCSTGIAVRFVTAAETISARWSLRAPWIEDLGGFMSETGLAGVDLYAWHGGVWRWLGTGSPRGSLVATAVLASELPGRPIEYLLYLPLLTGVEAVEIGVNPGASITPPARPGTLAPLCIYGTSIVQGCCASRAGMAYPAILGRRFDRPAINLGFCGSARMEAAMAELLAELAPAALVIDCLPNMREPLISERLEPAVHRFRDAHPTTPVVLVESITYQRAYLVASHRLRAWESNAALRAIYERLRAQGNAHVHLVAGEVLLGSDGEGSVDGTHPTDLGLTRIADAIEPVLRGALEPASAG